MDEVEAQFEVEGLEEPEPDRPHHPRRWWLLGGLVAALVLVGVLVDATVDQPEATPETIPELVPDPVPEQPTQATPGWSWVAQASDGWGNVVLPVKGALLVGSRTWVDGGTWSLVGWQGGLSRTEVGELPADPIAAVADDGTILVAGTDPAGSVVIAIDPATGAQSPLDVLPGAKPVGIEADLVGFRLLTADNAVWSWTTTSGWEDQSRTASPSADLVRASAIDQAARALQADGADSAVRSASTVRSSDGPGWSFVESCDGAGCDRWAKPEGGAWGPAIDLPGLPQWNGSEWWSAAPWAGRTVATVHFSTDGLAWETITAPDLNLASDELVVPAVLPGKVVVLTILRPDGTQEVLVGQRA